jgi:ribosome-associated heat shock protein Hsp15
LPASEASARRQRLDKWLWIARVVKPREAAAGLVEAGHVRINGQKTLKPGHSVKAGDVLTIVLNTRVRVLRIEGLGERRGPAEEARTLYSEAGMSPKHGETP